MLGLRTVRKRSVLVRPLLCISTRKHQNQSKDRCRQPSKLLMLLNIKISKGGRAVDRRQEQIRGPGDKRVLILGFRRPWSAESLKVHRPETKIPSETTTRQTTLTAPLIHISTSQPDKRAGGIPPLTRKTNTSRIEERDQRIHPRMLERSRLPWIV